MTDVALQNVQNIFFGNHQIDKVFLGNKQVRPEEPTPQTTPGTYWNKSEGIITILTENSIMTIADKNLGALIDYDPVSPYSEINCGTFFQRGNNYGFPFDGSVSIYWDSIDASGYGPGNYYNSSWWATDGMVNWESSNNENLWGGVTGTQVAMQGPCPSGFHIPNASEIATLEFWSPYYGNDSETYLKLPCGGFRDFDSQYSSGTSFYRGSEFHNYDELGMRVNCFNVEPNGALIASNYYTGVGGFIRPVKNEVVFPDQSGDRTVLYQPI